MPMLFWSVWPRLFLQAFIAIALTAPLAPFDVARNIYRGDYPPRWR